MIKYRFREENEELFDKLHHSKLIFRKPKILERIKNREIKSNRVEDRLIDGINKVNFKGRYQ